MSQNPFGPQEYNTQTIVEAPRTSLSAIASLVISLICCLPGSGILATLLGAFAVIRIGSSNGRKSGKFLAIAGIVIGLLVTAIQVGLLIGSVQMFKGISANIVQPMNAAFTQLATGDQSGLSAMLDPNALPAGNKAQTDRFWKEATDKLGAFKGFPDQQGFQFNQRGGGQNQNLRVAPGLAPLPLPVKFEKGDAVMMLMVNEAKWMDILFGSVKLTGAIENIIIVTEDGTLIHLIPPSDGSTPPAPVEGAPKKPSEPA